MEHESGKTIILFRELAKILYIKKDFFVNLLQWANFSKAGVHEFKFPLKMLGDKKKMTSTEVQQTPQEKQQLYLSRVNQFFAQVKNWLSDDFETIPTENYPVEDETGKYQIPSLSIVKKEVSESNNKIVDLFPKGTSVLMGEGFIEVHGVYGEESFIYMLLDGWIIQDRFGQIRPMYKAVKTDGWYWLESYHRNKASLVDKEVLMDVLKMVTLYDEP